MKNASSLLQLTQGRTQGAGCALQAGMGSEGWHGQRGLAWAARAGCVLAHSQYARRAGSGVLRESRGPTAILYGACQPTSSTPAYH
eukprot:320280-Chlamydomonas_euryale.AAC.3